MEKPFIRFDNTARVKAEARYVCLSTPPGNETFIFDVGQEVASSAIGRYHEGTRFVITERYMHNGFAYYRDDTNGVHRTKDIVAPAP